MKNKTGILAGYTGPLKLQKDKITDRAQEAALPSASEIAVVPL